MKMLTCGLAAVVCLMANESFAKAQACDADYKNASGTIVASIHHGDTEHRSDCESRIWSYMKSECPSEYNAVGARSVTPKWNGSESSDTGDKRQCAPSACPANSTGSVNTGCEAQNLGLTSSNCASYFYPSPGNNVANPCYWDGNACLQNTVPCNY